MIAAPAIGQMWISRPESIPRLESIADISFSEKKAAAV
ncbi:MAG: hypothetical protein ACI9MU_003927, partial [Alphaproteobacteria bacterium]